MLKTAYRVLALSLLLQGVASADVLLERITAPGHVMEPYAVSSRCTLDDNEVVETYFQLGDLKSRRIQQAQLSLQTIRRAINDAASGAIFSEIFPVDAETQIYNAYKRKPDGTYQQVRLWEENGGRGEKKVNQAPSAMKLKNFIDLNCKGAIQF